MQVSVIINGCSLATLLDSGSTHNFVDSAAAERGSLRLQHHSGLRVAVANGDRVDSPGCCRDLDIMIGGELSGHTTWCSVSSGWNHWARSCGTSPSAPWRSFALVIACSGQLWTRHCSHRCCLPRAIRWRSCCYTSTPSSLSQWAFRCRGIAATISTYCQGLHQW
jgi:hypothetical protein